MSVCDFCQRPQVRWVLPCNRFTAPLADGREYIDDGEWAACDDCLRFIEDGSLGPMLLWLTMIGQRVTGARVIMLKLFLANRTGPARAVSEEEVRSWTQ